MCFFPLDIKSDEELVKRDTFPRNTVDIVVLSKRSSKLR